MMIRQLLNSVSPVQAQMCENAYGYLTQERGVRQLVHFTPLNNVRSILKQGIVPHDYVPASAVVLDADRLDGYTDCSCFSVTFPNYKMFYSKRLHSGYKFAVLGIDPAVIADREIEDVMFFARNAAMTGAHWFNGVYGASRMFYDIPVQGGTRTLRQTLQLPNSYTTDPQAEILIRGIVPADYISCIYVEDLSTRECLMRMLGVACRVPVVVGQDIFKGRHDNRYWRGNY